MQQILFICIALFCMLGLHIAGFTYSQRETPAERERRATYARERRVLENHAAINRLEQEMGMELSTWDDEPLSPYQKALERTGQIAAIEAICKGPITPSGAGQIPPSQKYEKGGHIAGPRAEWFGVENKRVELRAEKRERMRVQKYRTAQQRLKKDQYRSAKYSTWDW